MDFKKHPHQFESGTIYTRVGGLPTVNSPAEPAPSKSKASAWGPLYVIGVFGCAFLLFHLYLTTTFHHTIMDRGLHRLEKELHEMMELQLSQSNVTTAGIVTPVIQDADESHTVPGTQRLPYGGLEELHSDSHRVRKRHRRSRMAGDPIAKRGGGATFTWFHPGQGACGGYNGDNDFIVAISHLIWNGGAHCGDTISITYNGKVVQATVVDECMGCDPNHIDLSPGLLSHIVGPGRDMVTDGTWSFGAAAPPKQATHKPTPKPTTSHVQVTSTARPTTTKTRLSSTSTQATSTSSVVSSSAYPTPSPEIGSGVQNLEAFTNLMINIGQVAMAGALVDNA